MMGVLKEYFLNSLLSQIKDVILYKIEDMEKAKHQIYTDLESEYRAEKNEIRRMTSIEILVEKYPNDAELGMAVRKLINEKINEGPKGLEGDNTLI